MTVNRVVGITVLSIGMTGWASGLAARETAILCTNPSSGASWTIRIDYDRHTVDSNSAYISPSQISWHDAHDGANYALDRKSGALTVVAASSTGGYFLHDHCKLPS